MSFCQSSSDEMIYTYLIGSLSFVFQTNGNIVPFSTQWEYFLFPCLGQELVSKA